MIATRDNLGQLKTASPTNSGGTWLSTEKRGYTYDTAWNLSYRTNGATTQTFIVNGKNELTNSVGTLQKYDANGNLTNSGTVYYGYDDENRLVEAWKASGIQWWTWWWTVYVYDGQSRLRIAREYRFEPDPPEGPGGEGPGSAGGTWLLNAETRYLYDGMLVLQERDSNNVPTVTYTRGTDLSGSREGAGGIGGLLARSHGYSAGNWSTHNFYHADGNGNITYLVDSSQSLAASYRYDPYGRLVSSSGSLATANVYRFSSKEVHARTGLYYYLYRWYAPEMQRWVTRDPIEVQGGINLYGFVGNNSISAIDLFGLAYGNPVEPPFFPKPYPPLPPTPPPNRPNPCPPKMDCDRLRDELYKLSMIECGLIGLGIGGKSPLGGLGAFMLCEQAANEAADAAKKICEDYNKHNGY